MKTPCKKCGQLFDRSDELAKEMATKATHQVFGPAATPEAKQARGMVAGMVAQKAEEQVLSLCAACEPLAAAIRLAAEADHAGQPPTVAVLRFLLEQATQPSQARAK